MSASRWSSRVIGVLSDWVRLDGMRSDGSDDDHPDATLPAHAARVASETAFKREVAWAVHLSLPALIVQHVTPDRCANAARCINQALLQTQVRRQQQQQRGSVGCARRAEYSVCCACLMLC